VGVRRGGAVVAGGVVGEPGRQRGPDREAGGRLVLLRRVHRERHLVAGVPRGQRQVGRRADERVVEVAREAVALHGRGERLVPAPVGRRGRGRQSRQRHVVGAQGGAGGVVERQRV